MTPIEVVAVAVPTAPACAASLWPLLDDDERCRARRLQRAGDRQRYVIGRATLRLLLGHRLRIAPQRLRFRQGPYGKPFLEEPTTLRFNSSHSGDWVVHALSGEVEVGIDIEAIRPELADVEAFAAVLAQPEMLRLRAVPQCRRAALFARIWTQKEAYVKAIGEGVHRTLGKVCTSPGRNGAPDLAFDHNPAPGAARWQFKVLPICRNHAACLAYPGEPRLVTVSGLDAAAGTDAASTAG